MAPAPAPSRAKAAGHGLWAPAPAVLVLALLIGLPLLTGAAAQDDDADDDIRFDATDEWADIQGIAIGDFWDYRSSGDARGTVRNEVAAIGNFTSRFGHTYHTYRIDSVADVEVEQGPSPEVVFSTTMHVESQKWVRHRDYATIEVRGNVTIEGSHDTSTVIAYDPILVEDVYPYQEGFEWRGTADRYQRAGEEEMPEDDYAITGLVEGRDTITVTAGTFETWRVRYQHGGSGYSIRWYSEEVCELVREDTYTRHGELRSTVELESYRCSHLDKERPVYDGDEVVLIKGEPRPFDRDGDGEDDEMIVGGDPPPEGDDKQSPAIAVGAVVIACLGTAAIVASGPRRRD